MACLRQLQGAVEEASARVQALDAANEAIRVGASEGFEVLRGSWLQALTNTC